MSVGDRPEARRWLAYAEDDIQAADILRREGAPPRQTCFLAQQAAEKALKAVLVSLGVEFARTHDLAALRSLIPASVEEMPSDDALDELTQWASQARYPGDFPEAREEDANLALGGARQVLSAATDLLAN